MVRVKIMVLLLTSLCLSTFLFVDIAISESEKTEEKIIVTTDKTEYQQGETIKISVKNNSDKSIWYLGSLPIEFPFWHIERFDGDKWVNLAGNFRLPQKVDGKEYCVFNYYEWPLGRAVELKPGSEIFHEWNQKICPYDMRANRRPETVIIKKVIKKKKYEAQLYSYGEPIFIEKGRYRFVFMYCYIENVTEDKYYFKTKSRIIIYSNEFTIE